MSYYVHESSIVEPDVQIGEGTKVWHFCHIMNDVNIGKCCSLGQNVFVGEGVRIGNGVKVQNNVSLYEGVEIEDDVFCGPSCVFTNDLTPRAKYPKGKQGRILTLVKTGATIGANSTIVCGHTLGEWSMVAAGAVVTKDVPSFALVAGTPARQIGWVCECGKRLGDGLECECGRKYMLENEQLFELTENLRGGVKTL